MKEYRESDPNNQWLGYFEPHHLTAEEIRDSMLTISGELNRDMGGVPAIPEINMEVALQPRMIQFSIAPVAQPSRTPSSRNRLDLYLPACVVKPIYSWKSSTSRIQTALVNEETLRRSVHRH